VNKPTDAEAFIAPELALMPALLVLLDGSLALLRAQHPQLDRPAQRGDARTLGAARALQIEIASTRAALLRYIRSARRAVRHAVAADAQLPF
jgi:hypothetical protein